MMRLQITIAGVVQGVGFRPFVYGLAARLGLAGFVANRAGDVLIEVEGNQDSVEQLVALLDSEHPAGSQIVRIESRAIPATGEQAFLIEASDTTNTAAAAIAPDVATCDACVAEIADPTQRRFGYPFASCASCGPRLTIVTDAPYDRARTTMAGFPMCDACRAEYSDVSDRRFHAQPIACPACGPALGMRIDDLAAALIAGEIVALKGLGGYHLVCDAARADVIAELRARKHRDAKPFAIMVRDLDAARQFVELDDVGAALLGSPARPIVLTRRREDGLPEILAPALCDLGVMLPYTPLHHLLLAAVDRPLVMTSANLTDEPIVFRDDDARKLGDIADRIVAHDCEIFTRCDDSVTCVGDGAPMILRRARGYAPAPLRLPVPLDRPTLALGGHFKAAFALGVGDLAFLSPHLGDLDDASAHDAFEHAIDHFQRLHRVTPERVACDAHPDYATTRLAEKLGLPITAIQHHRAHFASGHADAGLTARAIGVILDGHGYSEDGTIWGGELLVGDCAESRRVGFLRPVPQPGGDHATREPWRMAIAFLREAGLELDELIARHGKPAKQIAALCASAVRTSSTGRLFDAVVGVLGFCDVASYEGEAAMRLEALARDDRSTVMYPIELRTRNQMARGSSAKLALEPSPDEAAMMLDTLPIIRGVVRDRERGVSASTIARRFHTTLVELIARSCVEVARAESIRDVVLSGGVFANLILANEVPVRLRAYGLLPHLPRRVPPNDGGLAFGQLAAIAAMDRQVS